MQNATGPQTVEKPQFQIELSLRGRRPWQSASQKPYGFGRTTAKMETFWRTDCHVGLRPPRNDSTISTHRGPVAKCNRPFDTAFFDAQRVRCKGFCGEPFFLPGRVRQVAIGTCRVGLCEKPVALRIFISFQRLQFSISGKLGILFDINVFFEQNLYKVFGFQWTNRKICCIIISFLCCGRKAVIYWKR